MGLKNTRTNLVESFFIQHSLPRFPQPFNGKFGIFDSNITHKAQHFFCTSMNDEFEGQNVGNSLIPIDKVADCNFFKLLWKYTRTIKAAFMKYPTATDPHSMRPFSEIIKACNDTHLDSNENNLTSFTIQSTGTEATRLDFQIFAKAPGTAIDIYDDVTSLFSIHHEDYEGSKPLKTGNDKGKSAMLMIAQSHADPATLGINEKTLVDRTDFFATVHILNASSIALPAENKQIVTQQSMYRDHSKWSVNVIYGLEGAFPALLCFYDLNRSTKQAIRGGGAFCLNSSLTGSSRASMELWTLFMSFSPKPTDMARFVGADVKAILKQVLPQEESLWINDGESTNDTMDASSSTCDSGTKIAEATDMSYSDTRLRSLKRHRSSLNSLTPAPSRALFASSELSNAAYANDESGKGNNLSVTNPAFNILYQVPCPYKFKNTPADVIKNDCVPTKIIISITNAIARYDLSKINEAIASKGLIISRFSYENIFSPGHQYSQYNHDNTLQVKHINPNAPSKKDLNELINGNGALFKDDDDHEDYRRDDGTNIGIRTDFNYNANTNFGANAEATGSTSSIIDVDTTEEELGRSKKLCYSIFDEADRLSYNRNGNESDQENARNVKNDDSMEIINGSTTSNLDSDSNDSMVMEED